MPEILPGAVYQGIEPVTLRDILHKTGYKARLEKVEKGWIIESACNGTTFKIHLSGLARNCTHYQRISLSSGYQTDWSREIALAGVNKFNKSLACLKAHVDHRGDLIVGMDFVLGKGVSGAQIAEWLDLWRGGLIVFENFCETYCPK